jgi:hypothetical protein
MKVRGLWDSSQVQKKIHFTPKRRGREKIKFPMRAEKALLYLTGRPTLEKRKIAYLHYAVARNVGEMGWSKEFATVQAKKELRNVLDDDPWPLEFFKFHAERYAKWPRRNFDAAAHQQRLSKFLSELGAK